MTESCFQFFSFALYGYRGFEEFDGELGKETKAMKSEK